MKVVQINYHDIEGGAARAANRIHHALLKHGIDSQMHVNRAVTRESTVVCPMTPYMQKMNQCRSLLAGLLNKALDTESRAYLSPAMFPSSWPKRLKKSGADVVHLHWVGEEMMSIADIGRLEGPVVWTLHDMWAFCGAEHFSEDFRWREGYTRPNRAADESGFDLNRWTWQRKMKQWRRPMHIVAPSHWMADCVRQSPLMRDWPVSVIPNAIDTEVYQPIEKALARKLLRLPDDGLILLFAAKGGTRDPRKGFDLLTSALEHLRGEIKELELVVLGEFAPAKPVNVGFPIHYTGRLNDDLCLCLLYSAADAVVVPSRQESFSLCGAEAHACGTPVVAFRATALPGIVEHRKTGYLAKPFDTEDLARGIAWVLEGTERRNMLSSCSRQVAIERFSFPVVAEQYQNIYKAAVCAQRES